MTDEKFKKRLDNLMKLMTKRSDEMPDEQSWNNPWKDKKIIGSLLFIKDKEKNQ